MRGQVSRNLHTRRIFHIKIFQICCGTDTKTGRVYITSQNHGYAVVADSLPENAYESFVNANDGTCEGVTYTDMPVFTVQFHPEACGGPLDTSFLFDRFITMMKEDI